MMSNQEKKKFEKEGIYPKYEKKRDNPCFEKSFEAVDEANHPIRAAVVVDEGMRKFIVCHSRDGKDHMCYISGDNPEDQYKYVKKMFESWGYKVKEVIGTSCL